MAKEKVDLLIWVDLIKFGRSELAPLVNILGETSESEVSVIH